ncbi:MAG: hypothetical protein RIS36_1678 [Pseudomonadota bacterium]|jgi:Tfp pilus assembly protein PilV
MNVRGQEECGMMMMEALIAMTLVITAASGTLWFIHRTLRNAALQRTQLQLLCEQPTCSSDPNLSECQCGRQTFFTIR